MPITIKGALSVGETIKQAPQPVVKSDLPTFQQLKAPLKNNKHNFATREVPVKNTETEKVEKYKYIEEGELIKQFNKKSSYLNDMIQIEEDFK